MECYWAKERKGKRKAKKEPDSFRIQFIVFPCFGLYCLWYCFMQEHYTKKCLKAIGFDGQRHFFSCSGAVTFFTALRFRVISFRFRDDCGQTARQLSGS